MRGSSLLTRTRGPSIPLSTTAALTGPARRTLFLRALLALVLVGLVVSASATGRSDAAAARGLLPKGGGMLVLDVSRSIKPEADKTIVKVFDQLIASRSRIGLVVFSDIAYEMFPSSVKAVARSFSSECSLAATFMMMMQKSTECRPYSLQALTLLRT